MHEHSLMKNLMDKILHMAKKERAMKVTKICVKLGALSHMSQDHFKEHFDHIAQDTIAQDAEIDAEECSDIHDPHAQIVVLKSIDIE